MDGVFPMSNPLRDILECGQSIWFDNISRRLIESGDLKRMVEDDGLRGLTSNPAIFEKAVSGSADYDAFIRETVHEGGDVCGVPRGVEGRAAGEAKAIYERLAIRDIRDAADTLLPVFRQTDRRDGFVSLEVSPHLANDTEGTVEEARRLWRAVDRPNLMVKVPGTPAGVPAIRRLISEEINVNVTLLFSIDAYGTVAGAWLAGLEDLVRRGGDPAGVASVASFFVSRIDTAVDSLVADRLSAGTSADEEKRLRGLLGRVAIANARLAYQHYHGILDSSRWKALESAGARPQRLLWASTSTKNPEYRDVMYVEELIGPDTVNTIPASTYEAFRDHGRAVPKLASDVPGARTVLEELEKSGISLDEVTSKLLEEGVALFSKPFDKLLAAIEAKRREALAPPRDRMSFTLPADLDAAVRAAVDAWGDGCLVRRVWMRDKSVWTGADEDRWLGWLTINGRQMTDATRFVDFAGEVREAGFEHILLLGMGGSSLCPEVMAATFGPIEGSPGLHILDSTDPAQVKTAEQKIDPAKTLFIVSSKSGSTLEPNIFKDYFFDVASRSTGAAGAGRRFVAITDPGSALQKTAEADGFRRIFFGVPSIGGRYSALSDFGMVPAAAMGMDVPEFLRRTEEMVHACGACVPPFENPGLVLGAILGTSAKQGRDKVTLIASPGIRNLGAWLEQLLAESTGKNGRGLIPVDLERPGPPGVYGEDRLFVYLRLETGPDAGQDRAVEALAAAGHPVVKIPVPELPDLGRELFRWEFATAVTGSIIGINPFDQPDVEASKIETKKLTSRFEETGSLEPETPLLEQDGIGLYTDGANASALEKTAGTERTLGGLVRAHLARLGTGDYFALLAYLEMNRENLERLQAIRHRVRDARRVATCLGFGPRFLHSTGQAYKGGPGSGVFLQVTCEDAADLPIPGRKYGFGLVKAAQARGDFQVLADRGRRALRVHLGRDVRAGLENLEAIVARALE